MAFYCVESKGEFISISQQIHSFFQYESWEFDFNAILFNAH